MGLKQDYYQRQHWLECKGMNSQEGVNRVKVCKGSICSSANLEVTGNSYHKGQTPQNSPCWLNSPPGAKNFRDSALISVYRNNRNEHTGGTGS